VIVWVDAGVDEEEDGELGKSGDKIWRTKTGAFKQSPPSS